MKPATPEDKMRRLSQSELMKATALDRNLLKQLQHRNQVALAFGRAHCYLSLSYVELDAAAIMLADTLTKTYGRDVAAQIVRVHCDKWAEAVALYEIDYKTPGVFFVADFDVGNGKEGHLTGATNTTDFEAIGKALKNHPAALGRNLHRVTMVDLAPLIKFAQKTGAAHDIILLDRWVPKYGSPEFNEMFSPYADARSAAIKKISAERTVMVKAGDKVRTKFDKMIEVSNAGSQ
jgi:hypothetical protein